MITFKDYLIESSHKSELGIDEAIELIKTNCKDALKNKHPLYRGMTGKGDAYEIHGEKGGRRSANTTNYYTVIMDHFLPPLGYPKRSASIILSNAADTASIFGAVFAIFPYDDVPIGVCYKSDLWFSGNFTIGHSKNDHSIQNWNQEWKALGLNSLSYAAFVDNIIDILQDDTESGSFRQDILKDIFGTPDQVESILEEAYSPQNLHLELATTKTIDNYSDRDRELWIGGKCIAIPMRMYNIIKREGLL